LRRKCYPSIRAGCTAGSNGPPGTSGVGGAGGDGCQGNNGSSGSTASAGASGAGGVGVIGANLTIISSGTISGGLSGDGSTRADAISFTGGTNSLTLEAGSTITGNVAAFSSADTLALGGSTNASFDPSQIGAGAQYQGFGAVSKTGGGTWTLTGTGTTTTNWTINGGTLEVGSSSSPSTTLKGNVTVNGGGTLAGHGTVTGDVTNSAGGAVSPGGSIGTLTVNGDYSQGSTSTFAVEVSPSNASELLVTGTANLAGKVKAAFDPGAYLSKSYARRHRFERHFLDAHQYQPARRLHRQPLL
jgi:autotransporter-associated beta strand protein